MANQAQIPDLARLQLLAEAATSGAWERTDGCECIVSDSGDEAFWSWEQAGPAQVHGSGNQPVADADFIAAARPDVVLALIYEIAVLKAGGQLLVRDRNDALAERDRLKIETEGLRSRLLEAK